MLSVPTRRRILHVDMDAFYAAVEQRDRPELTGRPVIVGGSPRRGVVAAASYEARVFGLHSAMPIAQALRRCPQAVLVPPRFAHYRDISRQIRAIFLEYTPLVEPLALDEAFLELRAELPWDSAAELASQLKAKIRQRVALPCSVGVSSNKFLAKLGSQLGKPDGLLVIDRRKAQEILPALPVKRLWGVGPTTERKLLALGLRTVGELQKLSQAELVRRFGVQGAQLYRLARGRDDRPVRPERETKSVSRETTFADDLTDRTMLKRVLSRLTEQVARDLRRAGLEVRTVQLKVRFADFETITRSRTLPLPISSTKALQCEIELLFDTKVTLSLGVRLLGVGVANLRPSGTGQLALFGQELAQEVQIDRVLDELRRRFGPEVIQRGVG